MWHIHAIEHYSSIKRNGVLMQTVMWTVLVNIMLNKEKNK